MGLVGLVIEWLRWWRCFCRGALRCGRRGAGVGLWRLRCGSELSDEGVAGGVELFFGEIAAGAHGSQPVEGEAVWRVVWADDSSFEVGEDAEGEECEEREACGAEGEVGPGVLSGVCVGWAAVVVVVCCEGLTPAASVGRGVG